jgi:hypothetical protein
MVEYSFFTTNHAPIKPNPVSLYDVLGQFRLKPIGLMLEYSLFREG